MVQVFKDTDIVVKNSTLPRAKIDSNCANTSAQNPKLEDIIDVEDVSVQSSFSEHNPSKSFVPKASAPIATKKSGNSLPDDGYRSKQYYEVILLSDSRFFPSAAFNGKYWKGGGGGEAMFYLPLYHNHLRPARLWWKSGTNPNPSFNVLWEGNLGIREKPTAFGKVLTNF